MPERCFLTLTQQVAAHLHDPIRRGRWSAGMPGRHELAKEPGISDQTAEAALSQLEAEGRLEAQEAGRRRRVVPPKEAGEDWRRGCFDQSIRTLAPVSGMMKWPMAFPSADSTSQVKPARVVKMSSSAVATVTAGLRPSCGLR